MDPLTSAARFFAFTYHLNSGKKSRPSAEAAGRYARENCNYTWAGLLKTVPLALDSVSLSSIHKFARKSFKYMECYRKGLSVKQAEYAVKKYKSHRKIPDTILTDLDILTS